MARQILLLIEKSAHCLSYYDTGSGTRLHSVPLPDYPHEFTLDDRRAMAWIGHYGVANSGSADRGGHEVLALDIAGGRITGRLSLGKGLNRPHGVGMDGRGRLYALSEGAGRIAVWDDPGRGGAPDRTVPVGGEKPHLFAVTADGRRCYSTNLGSNDVTVFDPRDPGVTPVSIRTGDKPEGRLLRADEKMLFVTNRISETVVAIDTATFEILARESVSGDPVRIFHDPGRGRLMTIDYLGKTISLLDDRSLKISRRVALDSRPISMSFDHGMRRAFVSMDSDEIHVLDLDALTVTQRFATFREPDVSVIVTLDEQAEAVAGGSPAA
ncbi:YncE family protein [Paracoccus methylarcula]|uniref:YncE family protein n=1 Tax=Paracoccus methylarcula TaxID=72022 RepID=A0A422R246_9RHOB|nr:YncE family protein [Paracoccus methylarcula]RNF36272.1 YncE family protein [Paracoccus methylarcula]